MASYAGLGRDKAIGKITIAAVSVAAELLPWPFGPDEAR